MKKALITLSSIFILAMPVVSFAGVCGDANNDGVINLLDILYLIDYKYGIPPGPEPDCGTVTDIDGNVYQTVTIGTQVWMAENLKVTHYRDGYAIPNKTGEDWSSPDVQYTGAYCEYNNDVNNVATYGRLYNCFAVTDSRNIAPAGWHVPSDAEWQILFDFLGGTLVAGGKLKETGTAHWLSPNVGATNESGFTALPGGWRSYDGNFNWMGNYAFFWSSTQTIVGLLAYYQLLTYDGPEVIRYEDYMYYGFSVRCIKD